MWKLIRTIATLLCLGLVWLGLVTTPLVAAAPPFAQSEGEAEALLDELADRYEIITTRHGYVLRPREDVDFDLVEVEEHTVLLDGELQPSTRVGHQPLETPQETAGPGLDLVAGLEHHPESRDLLEAAPLQ